MDYDKSLGAVQIKEIEQAANKVIARNVSVKCTYPSPEQLAKISYRSKKEIDGAIRIVEIEDCDICACCAPHVRRTGEVGMLKVISTESWRGGTRVHILCGFRALEEFNKLQQACGIVSREYSVPVSAEAFSKAIELRNENVLKLKRKNEELQRTLMEEKLSAVDTEKEDITLFAENIDDIIKRDILNELVKCRGGFCSIFDGNDERGYSFIIASSKKNCNEKVKLLRENFGAKGGGKPVMVQGSVKAPRKLIEECFQ